MQLEPTSKWEISQNTKRTYGKPNEQLSPKRWPLSYLNLLLHCKYHLDTQKVKTVQKLTPKQANADNQTRTRVSNINYYLGA